MIKRSTGINQGGPNILKGKDRVHKRESSKTCAWKDALPNRNHETDKRMFYIPIEVFQDPKVKDDKEGVKDANKAAKHAASFAVCQNCQNHETNNIFFNYNNRNDICCICKNRTTDNSKTESPLPVCSDCKKACGDGNIDKDWSKQLLINTMKVVQHQYYDLNIECVSELMAKNTEASGPGNHYRRCDFVIFFKFTAAECGRHTEKRVVIYIELDKDQKLDISVADAKKDIETAIKIKVKEIYRRYNPNVLGIWKVNHNGNFTSHHGTVSNLDMYMRMVILRQYVYFVILNWDKLPAEYVWYFWYNHDRLEGVRSLWKTYEVDKVVNEKVHIIQEPPKDKDHIWKYCCDPIEGGCVLQRKEKKIVDGKETQTMVPDESKNAYLDNIVKRSKTPKELFGVFPYPNRFDKLEILS